MTTDHREAVEALEPCPFCGTAVNLRWDRRHAGPDVCFIRCGFVGCRINPDTGEHQVEAEAIAAWNRRSSLSDRVEEARLETARRFARLQEQAVRDGNEITRLKTLERKPK